MQALARVEGEGGLTIRLRDGQVESVELRIFEPPRFFEAFLRGRSAQKCPTSPPASAASARSPTRCRASMRSKRSMASRCRRSCGSYAGCSTAASGSKATRCTFTCCTPRTSSALKVPWQWHSPVPNLPTSFAARLRIKKAGNKIIQTVGGREVHPINVRVGGFYRALAATSWPGWWRS